MTLQVRIWLSLLLALLLAYTSYSGWRSVSGRRAVDERRPIAPHRAYPRRPARSPTAQLVDTPASPFALDSLKGKVWLASFFFSSCPGPCTQWMTRSAACRMKSRTTI